MGNIKADYKEEYNYKGYFSLQSYLSKEQVAQIVYHLDLYEKEPHEGMVREVKSGELRAVHGPHLYDSFFKELSQNRDIVALAEEILGEPCYLHQFKINLKRRFSGEQWPWHEDFVYWHEKDGVKAPKLVNIVLFLDNTDMLSGPLCFIPFSHNSLWSYASSANVEESDWMRDVSADLTYQLDTEVVSKLISKHGTEFQMGSPGDLLVFSPLLAHCSGNNMSPHHRRMLILTFNAISNAPSKQNRPEFLCGRP
ncbi:phytanoyl-CoA dioxygenase family protein [Pseudoalteromonas luteoviolacea]|uniref:Phytanoyl-CoA dioxygenase n=1 Tax=Pseudoalteromonas luteoviolacea S4060-1 TaxID=1365257 RepID=A0A161YHV1_9GAMM|nr:phytanoyl-CoA dioxygenase family protein [Pseudoalteromonas luteoviolacea]KZN60466.1 hypothetical protein N478_26185 [Pseudoalteromonas luteoviolacea S4060-1]